MDNSVLSADFNLLITNSASYRYIPKASASANGTYERIELYDDINGYDSYTTKRIEGTGGNYIVYLERINLSNDNLRDVRIQYFGIINSKLYRIFKQ